MISGTDRAIAPGASDGDDAGELGEVLGDVALEALVGQADRVDRAPPGASHSRGGGLPSRGSSVIVFDT